MISVYSIRAQLYIFYYSVKAPYLWAIICNFLVEHRCHKNSSQLPQIRQIEVSKQIAYGATTEIAINTGLAYKMVTFRHAFPHPNPISPHAHFPNDRFPTTFWSVAVGFLLFSRCKHLKSK